MQSELQAKVKISPDRQHKQQHQQQPQQPQQQLLLALQSSLRIMQNQLSSEANVSVKARDVQMQQQRGSIELFKASLRSWKYLKGQ